MPPSRFALFLIAASCLTVVVAPSHAQSATRPALTPDQTDARVFAILFRRENTYLKLARAAQSPDKPEAHLGRVLTLQFKLSDPDAASLEKVAADWERDTTAIRAQFNAAVAQFHSTFPNGAVQPGLNTTPPPALAEFRSQTDALTLHYRDMLHNSMREADFQTFHTSVQKRLASTLAPPTAAASTAVAQ